MGHYPGERWVVGVLILLLMLLFFAGNPLPMEKNLRAGTYDGIKVLYSEVAVEDPTDVSSLPKFEVTEQRELLVDGRNVGKLVASSWERIEDQNLITMSSDANRYGDQHVDNKEIYKTDPLPEGTYYVVNAYEPERLEILQIQGVILWKVYEAEYGEIWDKE